MKDEKGRVIYIGKSASLRDRVSSYFQAATKLEFKKSGLLECVVDFDVMETDTEVEALLAENRLIKDIQPKFNARLLDDKTFPYLMVTTGEEFPGVYVTRQPRTEGVKLFGPFTSVHSLKEAVTVLQKAFKFRTCHLEILESDENRRFFRPCLLYPIKQCTAAVRGEDNEGDVSGGYHSSAAISGGGEEERAADDGEGDAPGERGAEF